MTDGDDKGGIALLRQTPTTTTATGEPHPSPEARHPPDRRAGDDELGSWATAIHLIRYSLGSGFLLMPYLVKKLGYVMGAALILAVGLVYYHTMRALVRTQHALCGRLNVRHLTYVELADKLFQNAPRPVRKCGLCVRYLMYAFYAVPTGNATYLVLLANAVQSVGAAFNARPSTTLVISVAVGPLAAVCARREVLRLLVPYSSATNAFSASMAAVIVAASWIRRDASTAPVALRAFGDAAFVPEGVAMCAKAFRCTALVLPLKNRMRGAARMTAVCGPLSAAGLVTSVFYGAFGLLLYACYGEGVRENVLLNLPGDSYVTYGVSGLFAFALLVSYVLVFFGRFDNVWTGDVERWFAGSRYRPVAEQGVRLAINGLAYAFAVAMPNLAVIAAVSGTLGIVLEVALPAVLEALYVLEYDEKERNWIVFKNVCIVGVSVSLFAMNVYSCFVQIKKLYFT